MSSWALTLVLATTAAGCFAGPPAAEHWVVSVIATAAYEGAFDADAVLAAAGSLGWSASNGTSPTGFPAVVVEAPERVLYAYRAHERGVVLPAGWWIETLLPLPARVPVADGAEAQRWVDDRVPEYAPEVERVLTPLEEAGGFRRARLSYACVCGATET